jgi:putative glycosyltransferase (TIGR04372 family)
MISIVNSVIKPYFLRLYRIFLIVSSGVWAIPIIIIFRYLPKKFKIVICELDSSRIGHFVNDTFQHIVRRKMKEVKTFELFCLRMNAPISNAYFPTIVKRYLPIYFWVKYLYYWNCLIPGGEEIILKSSETGSHDSDGNFRWCSQFISFTENENIQGKTWLKQQGWKEGEPFVCLLVRDSNYLVVHPGTKDYNWDYHSYRNSDIESYRSSIKWLTDNEFWVLRMGKNMKNPINYVDRRFVDYSFHKDRSDFLDIWLFSNCNLCITTGSGIDLLAPAFAKPTLMLNFLPLSHMWVHSDVISYPKNLFWTSTGKRLTVSEYLDANFVHTKQYHEAGIKIIDLTSEEILEATKEAISMQSEDILLDQQTLEFKKNFFYTLRCCSDGPEMHRWIHPKARISRCLSTLMHFN